MLHAKKVDLRDELSLLKQQVEQLHEQVLFQQGKQEKNEQTLESLEKGVEGIRVALVQQKILAQKNISKQQQKVAELSQKVAESSEKIYLVMKQNNTETTMQIVQQRANLGSLKNLGRKYIFYIWFLAFGFVGIIVFVFLKNKKLNAHILQLKMQIQKNQEDISLFFQERISLFHQSLDRNANASAHEPPADFSLALKVADEITRMERNMAHMDSSVKGFKQLKHSVETLKDKLNSQGYEMPELLGKKFNSGMKLTVVSSFPADTLAPGEEVISKIIKPQVNYKGKMIQSAQVEVSIGE